VGLSVGHPPFPAQTPSTAWAIASVRWGSGAGVPIGAFSYYFTANPAALGVYHANTFASDWSAKIAALWPSTFFSNLVWGAIFAYSWDGTVFHQGFGGAGGFGALPFSNRPYDWCALIKKWAFVGTGQVLGYWHSPIVNSTHANGQLELTAIGTAKFSQWAQLYTTTFVSEGNSWTPCIFSPRGDGGLHPINMVQVQPKLHYLRKRNWISYYPHQGTHKAAYVLPIPTPTPTG
jgi:hypothetical protein